jgi:5-methylcytosine-specific restriction endonuclease McrA
VAGHLAAATCRFLVLLAEFDERRGWASWEMNSCAQWLSWKCQMSSGTAREHVRVARALRDLPVIRREFAAGRLSYVKVRALTRIATPATEEGLADMAIPMTGNQLERFARAHRQCSSADDAAARVRRRLTWRFEEDGSLAGSFRLPPLAGAVLLKALRAAASDQEQPDAGDGSGTGGVSAETPPAPGEPVVRTSSDLADALLVVAESFLAGKVAGADDAEVYQVILHVGTDAIAAPAPAGVSAETLPSAPAPPPAPGDPADPARCHVEDGAAVSVTTAQMIGCTAALSWMTHAAGGAVLNLGRRRRRPNAAIRKAARERDHGRCQYPGCESRRVDLHHIQHWANGGPTSLENLVSLCKQHHLAVHDRGYLIAVHPGGTFAFYAPSGIPVPASPALPSPDGSIDDIHDADITPETIIPPWHGERLDLDYAIYTCLANEQLRRDCEAGHDSQDDLPPRHPGIGEPVDLIAAIRGRFAGRPQPQPYAPIQIPIPV